MAIKSLAMLKMEKNFRALKKGYPQQPYKVLAFIFLIKRLKQEVHELELTLYNELVLDKSLSKIDIENAKFECADISNITDYIFEKLLEKMKG